MTCLIRSRGARPLSWPFTKGLDGSWRANGAAIAGRESRTQAVQSSVRIFIAFLFLAFRSCIPASIRSLSGNPVTVAAPAAVPLYFPYSDEGTSRRDRLAANPGRSTGVPACYTGAMLDELTFRRNADAAIESLKNSLIRAEETSD